MLTLDVGSRIGPYRIDALLGAGGMGVVYRAMDCSLRRVVAIKMVDPRHHEADSLDLLLQEARIAAALNHPGICAVHEVGHADGEPYIVMEHVEGTLLQNVIASRAGLPLETALHYAMQIVDAVAHAHAHGVVHGDLKATNVMIRLDGRVKILDFGLAVEHQPAAVGTDAEATRGLASGRGSGTLPYMAPELLRGGRADARSDIWALGVIFYEMLAGFRPFRGATPYELAAAILSDPSRPLSVRTPAAVRALVARCLAKAPSNRFASARDLLSALDDLGNW